MRRIAWLLPLSAALAVIAVTYPLHAVVPHWIALVVAAVAIGALVASLRRITQRAQHSERRLSEAFHASPVPLAMTNVTTSLMTEVNDAFVELVGWSRDELLRTTAVELGIYSAEMEVTRARWLKRSGMIRNHQTIMQRRDGELREVILSIELLAIAGEPFSLTTIIDHTDRLRTEAELRTSHAQFAEIAATIQEVFWMTDLARTQLLYVSPAFETIWLQSCASVRATPANLLASIHPEDRDGTVALFAANPTPDSLVHEFRIVRPGGAIRWVRTTAFTVRDARGAPVRLAGVATDITVEHELEDQFRQAQKMESLGLLAGGVAHDFNNVLAVISSCNGMVAEGMPATHPDRELVDDITAAVGRAAGLTEQLLAFSRKQVTAPVVLDLNAAVSDTRKMLRRMVGEDVTVTTSLDPELKHVRIDPGCLVQVLMNLAVNARDAMPRGGTLEIATRVAGDEVMLSVTDSGSGMPADVVKRIFEPFFTTKAVGHGTGMGLAVVHGVVDQAGGRLQVQSEIDIGTRFRVFLPAIDAPVEVARVPLAIAARGVETIMLVDDDEYVRRCAARVLRSRGYTVLEAGDGSTALRALDELRLEIDLLLTDVVMPGLDGRQLAEAACATRPRLKILYTSGYTDDEVVRRGVKHREVELLQKPFRVEVLAGKVREILDRS